MYYCKNCKSKFEKPESRYETHGFSSPPFERIYYCPHCGSENFKEIQIKYCRSCGARLKNTELDYCDEACRISGEKLRLAEYKRTKQFIESPLVLLVKELNDYNNLHRTHYSYGQYVTLIKPKLKDKKDEH